MLILVRIRLSSAVGAAALAGAVLAAASWLEAAGAALGVFFLAAGATALNQVQERELDARMARTRNRPLPAGRLTPRQGLVLALLLLAGGLLPLIVIRPLAGALGTAAVLLYNGVYTPLKRRTLFALLPGALAGALPPIVGWYAGGGHLLDFRAILPAGLLFLWQVPHFWLFAERHRDDYRQAGLPTPDALFAPRQLHRLTSAWTAALAAGTLALPLSRLVHLPALRIALSAVALWLLALAIGRRPDLSPAPFFHRLTAAMAAVLAIVILDGLLV